MSQTRKVSGVATVIGRDDDGLKMFVQYHKTKVVRFSENSIILNSGGWRSSTTKTRMNQTANQFGLGFGVYQEKGEWFVSFKGETIPFEDGMTLYR